MWTAASQTSRALVGQVALVVLFIIVVVVPPSVLNLSFLDLLHVDALDRKGGVPSLGSPCSAV